MLDFMERSAIKLLKKRGNTDTEIAKVLDRNRKTVRRALVEPADKQFERLKRGSLVDPYKDKILQWIQESVPVKVMLEKVKKDSQIPRDTRYCFVGRLKYSRWIHTEFHTDMRYETLIRCSQGIPPRPQNPPML